MLNILTNKFNQILEDVNKNLSKMKNTDFFDAVIAACVSISYADGVLEASEKQKTIQAIRNSETLKAFDTEDAIKKFAALSEQFDFDFEIGFLEALKRIRKIKNDKDSCVFIMNICRIIGAADGNYDSSEKKVATKICNELGLNPRDFSL